MKKEVCLRCDQKVQKLTISAPSSSSFGATDEELDAELDVELEVELDVEAVVEVVLVVDFVVVSTSSTRPFSITSSMYFADDLTVRVDLSSS